jgi:acylpyruvate hydrolase
MKIICVGRNYAAHAKELNNTTGERPVIFMKPETALIAARQPFFMPKFSDEIHHEIEIVVRINKVGKNISEKFASRYYDEITAGIDFTARDIQQQLKQKGLPWELAKAFDGSAPIGSWLPFAEFKKKPIVFSLMVNGEPKQKGSTADMLFSINSIISFVSTYITLKKGDLIFTGTPEGVGPVHKGDHLEAFIEERKVLDLKVR